MVINDVLTCKEMEGIASGTEFIYAPSCSIPYRLQLRMNISKALPSAQARCEMSLSTLPVPAAE